MKTKKIIFSSLVLPLLLMACAGTPVKIEGVTDLSTVDLTSKRRVSAEAGGFQLAGFIPLKVNTRQERAYEALLETLQRDEVLADITVTESWSFAVVGTSYWTIMHSSAYRKLPKP